MKTRIHDVQRAKVSLAARVLQLVVKLRILKIMQIERERLADDGGVDRIAESRVQHMLKQRVNLRQHRAGGDDAKLEQQIRCDGLDDIENLCRAEVTECRERRLR